VSAVDDLACPVFGFPAIGDTEPAREFVDDDETRVVPGTDVAPARVAQADDEA
jgi:hypothetical protein